jgi:hypothetical protein
MSQKTTTAGGGIPASPATGTNGTRALLACGVVAGPLFVAVALLQVLTRQGFDLTRHRISLLAEVGPGGRCCSAATAWA